MTKEADGRCEMGGRKYEGWRGRKKPQQAGKPRDLDAVSSDLAEPRRQLVSASRWLCSKRVAK